MHNLSASHRSHLIIRNSPEHQNYRSSLTCEKCPGGAYISLKRQCAFTNHVVAHTAIRYVRIQNILKKTKNVLNMCLVRKLQATNKNKPENLFQKWYDFEAAP